MAELSQLESALVKADAASDTEGARILAGEIRKMRNAAQQEGIATPETSPITTAESVLSNPVIRAGLGASSLLTGPFQLGANVGDKIAEAMGNEPIVGKWTNEKLALLEAIKRRGMAKKDKNEVGESWDVAGGIGQMAGGVGAIRNLPMAETILKKTLQGSAIGTGLGAATPVVDGGDGFFGDKAMQTGSGAAVGGIIPLAAGVIKPVFRGIADIVNLFTPGGAGRIADKYTHSSIGEGSRQKVIDALRNAKEIVPGSKPTAAEAVSALTEGSPIMAQQRITAQSPGGISAQFGQRTLDQMAARDAASAARNELTTPMREKAISLANQNGVKSTNVLSAIEKTKETPGLRASDVVGKTLKAVQKKINKFTTEDGLIDANDLYMIRKELGNTIKLHSKKTQNWDKRLSAKLQSEIQAGIDDAIESAGGKGWKEYLSKFSEMTGNISEDIARTKNMYSPVQKTNLGGGVNIAEQTRTHIPQLLSRPAMVANAIMRYMGMGIEPKVDKIMAQQQLNPNMLADALDKFTPSQKSKVIKAILMRTNRVVPAQQAANLQGE